MERGFSLWNVLPVESRDEKEREMMKSTKLWIEMGLAVIAGLVGSASGVEMGEIRFQGGHPWLSKNQLISVPLDKREDHASLGLSQNDLLSSPTQSGVIARFIHDATSVSSIRRIFDITVSMYKHRTEEERRKIEAGFASFAQGVYEATEGRHCIGKVRFIENPAMVADIIWEERGHPHADINMFGRCFDNRCIHMYDFDDKNTKQEYVQYLEYPLSAGQALAHEWGHYCYGFGDEYARASENDTTRTTDNAVYPSLMGDRPILNGDATRFASNCNLSIKYHDVFSRLPTSDSRRWWRDTGQTHQHRLHNKSCMEYLVSTPLWEDDFHGISPDVPPTLNLGASDGKHTALLFFCPIWMDESRFKISICLDRSGSMGEDKGKKMERVKAAAQAIVDVIPKGNFLELIPFDTAFDGGFSFREVTDENRAEMKNAIDAIIPRGGTHIWDAAWQALEDMNQFDPDRKMTGSIFLLSDGKNGGGIYNSHDVVERCRTYGVALNSISYGDEADAELEMASSETGGRNLPASVGEYARLNGMFNWLFTYSASRDSICFEEGTTTSSGVWQSSFNVDSSAKDMQVAVTLSSSLESSEVILIAPSKVKYAANVPTTVGEESSRLFLQAKPEPGVWTVSVRAPSDTSVALYADTGSDAIPPRMSLMVDDDDSTVYASLSYGESVDRAAVRAVISENGAVREVPFEPIGGGMYKLALADCGVINDGFTVRADATKGVAKYTYVDVMDYMGDGEGTPIAESFTRSEWVALGKENAVTFYSSGKGKLEFQWRTSGDGVPDKIDFLCNGNTTATLVSGQGWTKKEIVFDEEEVHVFQWVTPSEVRKFSGTWLKEVIWHPEPDVAMGSIEVSPRWPWDGKVDIDYVFVPTVEGTKATFSVSGVDGDLGTTIKAKTLSGMYRNLEKGTYRVTWDLGADAPGFHSSAFAVQLAATIDPFPAPVVTVSSTASGGNRLEWDSVGGAESYSVFRGTNAAGTGAVEIGTVKADAGGRLSFQDSAAPHGQTVWYAVKASAWKLDGERSAWVSARRPMLPPTNLAATYGTRTDGVLVSWTPSTGTGRSRIYRFVSSDLGGSNTIDAQTWGHAICETTNSSWLDTTTAPGVDYVYSATCVSPEGEESFLPTELYPPPTEILMEDATLMGGVSSTRIQSYSPAIGWRNMEAPNVTSATRKDTVQKGPGVWAPIYRNRARFAAIPIVGISRISKIISSYDWAVTSVFDLEWEAVPGALTYKIIHWPSSSSSETESAVTTPTSFSYSITKLSLVGIEYPASRTFRIVPMSAEHSGNATTIDIK